jgi:hypothetical protein
MLGSDGPFPIARRKRTGTNAVSGARAAGDLQDLLPQSVRHGQDRKPGDSNEVESAEARVTAKDGQGDGMGEPFARPDPNAPGASRVLSVGTRVARDLGRADNLALRPGVIEKNGVPGPHFADVAEGEGVVDAVPIRLAVALEVGERVVSRLLLDEPSGQAMRPS